MFISKSQIAIFFVVLLVGSAVWGFAQGFLEQSRAHLARLQDPPAPVVDGADCVRAPEFDARYNGPTWRCAPKQ